MKFMINLEIDLDNELLACIEADIPHSISYWGDVQRDEDSGRITIVDRNCDDVSAPPDRYDLPSDWVAVGIKRLIEGKKPARHALAIIRECYDGENVDCLVQMAIFNELRYG